MQPMSASSSPDVVVVGGGIVGTAAAAFLAEAGASVVLIDGEGLASGASGANSGVVQHPFDPVLAALYHETLSHYRRLEAAAVGFRMPDAPSGMLFVSHEEAATRRVASELAGPFPAIATDVVGGADLQKLEPAMGPDLWACRADIGFPVAPAAGTYGYATLAEHLGAVIRVGRPAELVTDGDQVTGVRVGGQVVRADVVLIAAGPATPRLVDPTGRWVPIRPRWGVVVEADLPDTPRHVLEEAGIEAAIGTHAVQEAREAAAGEPTGVDFSIVPHPEGSAVGSTFLPDEPDPAAWMEPILVGASRYVPGVAEAPIRGVRACARPQSLDGLPLIGAVPGLRGLFVCAGHGPWGISTGPASARLASELILGRGPVIPNALDPARFGVVPGS
jgi:D-amino-acid dehydrogenase